MTKRLCLAVVAVALTLAFSGVPAFAEPIFGIAGLPSWPQIASTLNLPKPPTQQLDDEFKKLSAAMARDAHTAGAIGLAVMPVGSDTGQSFGSLRSGRAWSTLKVPVSLAAQRRDAGKAAAAEDKAIKLSDNESAEDLWDFFGSSRAAVDAVTQVLRDGHDTVTQVSSELDSPRSYPGYTDWGLIDQARFGAHLPCLPDSDRVLTLMGSVARNQQWGAFRVNRVRGVTSAVKGGWGPVSDAHRGHIVRQLAVLTTGRGQVAVSMAAIPRTGSFADGVTMLNRIGTYLARNVTSLPAGRCALTMK